MQELERLRQENHEDHRLLTRLMEEWSRFKRVRQHLTKQQTVKRAKGDTGLVSEIRHESPSNKKRAAFKYNPGKEATYDARHELVSLPPEYNYKGLYEYNEE